MTSFTSKFLAALRSFSRPRFKMLAYHGVVERDPGPYEVTRDRFEGQMRLLRQGGYRVCGIREAVEAVRAGGAGDRCVVITFDDGDENVYHNAAGILVGLGMRATVFAITGYAGRSAEGRAGFEGTRTLMGWEQLGHLRQMGFEIRSHSVSHPDLTSVPDDRLREEVWGSHRDLEAHLGRREYYFAYPYGLLNERVRSCVEQSPHAGAVCFGSVLSNWERTDPYLLKREKVLAAMDDRVFRRIIDPRFDLPRAVVEYAKKMRREARQG